MQNKTHLNYLHANYTKFAPTEEKRGITILITTKKGKNKGLLPMFGVLKIHTDHRLESIIWQLYQDSYLLSLIMVKDG